MTAQRLRIAGRVQGVGFRQSMAAEARRLGVGGWVRNREDGSVEAQVQGPTAAVAALVGWARRGPTGARVDQVEAAPSSREDVAGFEIRATG